MKRSCLEKKKNSERRKKTETAAGIGRGQLLRGGRAGPNRVENKTGRKKEIYKKGATWETEHAHEQTPPPTGNRSRKLKEARGQGRKTGSRKKGATCLRNFLLRQQGEPQALSVRQKTKKGGADWERKGRVWLGGGGPRMLEKKMEGKSGSLRIKNQSPFWTPVHPPGGHKRQGKKTAKKAGGGRTFLR